VALSKVWEHVPEKTRSGRDACGRIEGIRGCEETFERLTAVGEGSEGGSGSTMRLSKGTSKNGQEKKVWEAGEEEKGTTDPLINVQVARLEGIAGLGQRNTGRKLDMGLTSSAWGLNWPHYEQGTFKRSKGKMTGEDLRDSSDAQN